MIQVEELKTDKGKTVYCATVFHKETGIIVFIPAGTFNRSEINKRAKQVEHELTLGTYRNYVEIFPTKPINKIEPDYENDI